MEPIRGPSQSVIKNYRALEEEQEKSYRSHHQDMQPQYSNAEPSDRRLPSRGGMRTKGTRDLVTS